MPESRIEKPGRHAEPRLLGMIGRHAKLAVVVVCAVSVRILLLDSESGDYVQHLAPWYDFIQQHGFRGFRTGFSNYSPLYLYLLWAASVVFPNASGLLVIKAISIVFDFVCAFFVSRIVRMKYPSGPMPFLGFSAVLLAPTVMVNGAGWAQSDVVYTTGLLVCLYCLLARRETLSLVAYGLALAIKLQAVFFAPFLAVLVIKGVLSWKKLWLVPGVYLLTLLPAWFAGRPLTDLLAVYHGQATLYHDLSRNAPNLYTWFPNGLYAILCPAGIVGTFLLVVLFCGYLYRSRCGLTSGLMIQMATLSVLGMPYFLPKMHERYFFPADVLTIIFACYRPRYSFVPVVTILTSYLSYYPFLFGKDILPMPILAIGPLVLILVLAWDLRKQLSEAGNESECAACAGASGRMDGPVTTEDPSP